MIKPCPYKLLVTAAIAGLLFAGIVARPTAADAAISYDFAGTCDNGCSEIGLSLGDPVFATFDFVDSSFFAGATLGRVDVVSFAVDFGIVEFSSATDSGFDFAGTVASDLSVSIDSFVASGLAPSSISYLVSIDPVSWAAFEGECQDPTCSGAQSGPQVAGVIVQLASVSATDVFVVVPEPASVGLFAMGLLFIVVLARRPFARVPTA